MKKGEKITKNIYPHPQNPNRRKQYAKTMKRYPKKDSTEKA